MPGFGQPGSFDQSPGFGRPLPPPTPSVCPRCYSQIYPGYTKCSNCGYDTRASWGAPSPVAPARASTLPIALAMLGIAFLVAAVALVVVTQSNTGAASTPSPSATLVAAASPTPTLAPTPTPVPTPTPTASAGSLVSGTPEPSPSGWVPFSSPDGKWSVSFPVPPVKTTTTTSSGTTSVTETTYTAHDPGAAYVVDYADLSDAILSGTSPDNYLIGLETSLATNWGATVVRSEETTLAGYPARESLMVAQGLVRSLKLTLVGSRVYILMTGSLIGSWVYPQHFFATFKLK